MHIPVLYNETLRYLDIKPGENFIDCTLGDGGHTFGILKRNAPGGKVLSIDLDIEMIERVITRITISDLKERIIFVQDNFANLERIINDYKFKNIAGVLLDLGMSSYHLDNSERGFSFQRDERLDMRYSVNFQFPPPATGQAISNFQSLTADEIINTYSKQKLEEIFLEYGEERFAGQIARKIVEVRQARPIHTTRELVSVIKLAIPLKYQHSRIHFATKIFQALRIAVNQEIENLKLVLPQAFDVLEKGGRLVVISFHSLEDRIVKNFFRDKSQENKIRILTKKPVTPSDEEISSNSRARSAKMRVAIKN